MRASSFRRYPLGLALAATVAASAAPLAMADLLISEYVEGSGNNKALEFYNTGDAPLALDGHQVEFYFNGAREPGRRIELTGSLAAGAVHVLVHGEADPALRALGAQVAGGSWYNGDDAILLRAPDGAVVDSLGQLVIDPGSTWGGGNTQTADRTLVRLATVTRGDREPADGFDPAAEWQGFARDTFASLGGYGPGSGEPGGGGAASERSIAEVQGREETSPLANQVVIVEGIVVGDFQGEDQLRGFFIQSSAGDADSDALTSEGLFIYGGQTDVQVGDRVRVQGRVEEFNGLTELTAPQVSVLARGQALPAAVPVRLPLASSDALERLEGMRVASPTPLIVSEVYNLGRYGELVLTSGERLWIPTHRVAPGAAAQALQAQNDLDRLVLDDGLSGQNPDPVRYPAPQLSAYATVRVGDRVEGVQGVLHYLAGSYRIQPTVQPTLTQANPRPAAPEAIDGRLRVASFNVLNYFNGDGQGGGFPTSRGADSLEEFQRQREKVVAAILGADVHIIGLMEIENDGYGADSAIADLVTALNRSAVGRQRYAYVDPRQDRLGTDEIAVGLIYREDVVRPHKAAAVLDASVDPRFDDTRNRPALAQTFRERHSGERLTVAVNHLKSKGSSCEDRGDPDRGDGQGNCNLTRALAAQALVDWLATDPTRAKDPDRLVIGDLNAYAKEDPITVIRAAGYVDLLARFVGDSAYSYVFEGQSGYLDHALASPTLAGQIRGATEWHINADEPRTLDYNLEFKTPRQQSGFYSQQPYRASDHDPLVIGIDLNRR